MHHRLTLDEIKKAVDASAKRMEKYSVTQRRALRILGLAKIRNLPLSRSYEWQLKMMALGRCRSCARKTRYGQRCKSCSDKNRDSRRNSYRRKAGIPIHAPLSSAGRPRK